MTLPVLRAQMTHLGIRAEASIVRRIFQGDSHALARARLPVTPEPTERPDMTAIYAILLFLVVFLALNKMTFGRFD